MLFKKHILDGIEQGRVTLAFRRWRRPTVKEGGTLQTPAGLLLIKSVEVVPQRAVTHSSARKAGYSTVAEIAATLRSDGELYRIEFERIGDDPRIALRADDALSEEDVAALQIRLVRLDNRSKFGAWTTEVLQLISEFPGTRAAELAGQSRFDKEWLKTNIRKLKNLGLTESLDVGYRLSPRGRAFLLACEGA